MLLHDASVTAPEPLPAAEDEDRALRAFVARLGGARARARVIGLVVQVVAPATCVLVALAFFSPRAAAVGGVAAALVFTVAAVLAVRHERHFVRSALLALHGRGVALADGVLAFWEAQADGRADSAMGQWLRTDLAAAVAALPATRERDWLAPRLGRWRYAVAIAVALLLFFALLPDFDLDTPGLKGPRSAPWFASLVPKPKPVSQPVPGVAVANGKGGSGQNPPPSPSDEDESKPPGEGEEQKPPEAPAPYLDLPTRTEVLVPDLVRDGPTRRALAQSALTGNEEEGGAAPPTARPSGGNGDVSALPQPTREEFQRAKERALMDRRVPARERAIVRLFFSLLEEEGK